MKKFVFIVLLIFWLIMSLFVRTIGLEKSPVSVGFDEASLGYNAYSLYLTGKDEYGVSYPLSLRSFNDFKPALYAYLEIPFIHFLGLNQTSTRAPSAIFGTISLIFLLLIFTKTSGKSLIVSLGILAFISFLPWRLHFSRVAFEANISMAFFTGVVWCLLNFNKNIFYKIGAILLSTLAIYSYHAARLAIPILLFLTLVDPLSFSVKKFLKKPLKTIKNLWPLFLVLILYIPLFLEFQASFLLTRFDQTNVFSHFYPFTPRELIFMSNVWFNLVGHPLYYLSGILLGHIVAYLSPQNLSLLIYPGVIKSAQAISGSGMLGFLGGLLFIIGVIFNVKKFILNKENRIIIYWILAGIIPAVITWEWFYPLRSLNTYPAIDLIAGLGLITIFKYLLRIKLKPVKYSLLTAFVLIGLSTSFFNIINEYNYGAWDINGEFQPGGFKEGVPLLMSLKDKYQTIYLDSNQAQSYELFWFYMKYPPQNIQRIAGIRNQPGIEGPPNINFDNFIYKKFDWPHDKLKNNFIFWTTSEVKEAEINSAQGTKLYKILGPTGNWIASIITKT
jgi:hypothetical protein